MNDPHVEHLDYRIEHGPGIDWSKAAPSNFEEDGFDVEIEDRRVRFRFRIHHSSESEARAAVEAGYIPNWEFTAGLKRGPNAFSLRFDRAGIIDRNPRPGPPTLGARASAGCPTASLDLAPPRPPAYPNPPGRRLARTPDVESMHQRYLGHLDGREPLPSMAYFCLTMLFKMASKDFKVVAGKFGISRKVLCKIRTLSSLKGGPTARKADTAKSHLTQEEERFLISAVRMMILRAAEVECDPGAAQNRITRADIR